jgi:predicted RNase H-like HicB family nuclease
LNGTKIATVPVLRGCHTQAKNLETLMKLVREVVELSLGDDHVLAGARGSFRRGSFRLG